jgi:uncharacterized protein YndB with AHSA1/START domain
MRRWFASLVLGVILMAATMEGAMAETFNLTVTRVVEAPAEAVWRALTEAEAIKQWWGPQGFTAPVVETDMRAGGATLVCMTAPGFPLLCNSWTYTALLPNERMAFDQGWVDETGARADPKAMGLPPDIPAVVPHVVELKPLPDGKTELRWSEFGYASAETVAQSRMGLESVLDKLVASLR